MMYIDSFSCSTYVRTLPIKASKDEIVRMLQQEIMKMRKNDPEIPDIETCVLDEIVDFLYESSIILFVEIVWKYSENGSYEERYMDAKGKSGVRYVKEYINVEYPSPLFLVLSALRSILDKLECFITLKTEV